MPRSTISNGSAASMRSAASRHSATLLARAWRLTWAVRAGLLVVSFGALAVLGTPGPTSACLHAGPGFEISQRAFEAFAVVHDGREDLVPARRAAGKKPRHPY